MGNPAWGPVIALATYRRYVGIFLFSGDFCSLWACCAPCSAKAKIIAFPSASSPAPRCTVQYFVYWLQILVSQPWKALASVDVRIASVSYHLENLAHGRHQYAVCRLLRYAHRHYAVHSRAFTGASTRLRNQETDHHTKAHRTPPFNGWRFSAACYCSTSWACTTSVVSRPYIQRINRQFMLSTATVCA